MTTENPDPSHDAFTRWHKEIFGRVPTPDEVKRLLPAFVRRGLHLPEERYVKRSLAETLAKGDPASGIPPYDPATELAAAARRGIDLTKDPHFLELAKLVEEGRRRLTHPEKDPKRVARAKSGKLEKRLRKSAGAAQKKRSKVLRGSTVKDPDRDYSIVREIHGFLKISLPVRLVARKSHLVSPPSFSPSSKPATTTHDQLILTPHWEKAAFPIRAMAFGIAAANIGGRDFTLHLGDSGIAYAMGGGGKKFAQRLYRRISDALDAKCPPKGYPPPDFFFVVEKGVGERPHLHGIIIPPKYRHQQNHLRNVLQDAVGTDWLPSPEATTQLEIGLLYEPIGWIDYILKYTEQTKAEVGSNIFACSRLLTQAGTQWYEHMRKSGELLLPGRAVALPTRP